MKNKQYYITSGMDNVDDNNLEFRQFASYLRNTLNMQGYVNAPNKKDALEIRLSYGISAPKRYVTVKD